LKPTVAKNEHSAVAAAIKSSSSSSSFSKAGKFEDEDEDDKRDEKESPAVYRAANARRSENFKVER